tara:strand:- start:695 stop:991 length:297 start_codon:yes stop_codon:yes gene_type:complete
LLGRLAFGDLRQASAGAIELLDQQLPKAGLLLQLGLGHGPGLQFCAGGEVAIAASSRSLQAAQAVGEQPETLALEQRPGQGIDGCGFVVAQRAVRHGG